MARPRWVHKPIWGFGPVGWVLAVSFAVILTAKLAGVDLRHELLRLILSLAGTKAMYWFVSWWLPCVWFLIDDAAFGPVGLCIVLLFAHFNPRRVPWWQYGLLGLWCITLPPLLGLIEQQFLLLGYRGPATFRVGLATLELTFTVVLLSIVMRDRHAVLLACGGVLAAQLAAFHRDYFAGAWAGLPYWFSRYSPAFVYNAGLAAGLTMWVMRSRRQHRLDAAGACAVCGYALVGLPLLDGGVTCPECGTGPRLPSATVLGATTQNSC